MICRRGRGLLNQQFWLWGRDIRRAGGNLLIDHGFAKCPPPVGLAVPSRYELTFPNDARLTLWGFGLLYSDPSSGGLFLSRMKLTPRLAPPLMEIWSPTNLPALEQPATRDEWERVRHGLVPALHWIAAYEQWITLNYGEVYRQQCLDGWHRPVCQSAETATQWTKLAAAVNQSLLRATKV